MNNLRVNLLPTIDASMLPPFRRWAHRHAGFPLNVFCLLALSSGLCIAAAQAKDAPPKSWVDASTGHRVLRLTDEEGSASLYFNDNAFSADGREMIYTTPDGISVLDVATWKTRSLVKGKVRVIVTGARTQRVFYSKPDEHSLYAANLDTGKTERLADIPAHATIGTINADETLAAGTYLETDPAPSAAYTGGQTHPLDQPKNKGQMMEERLAAHYPLVLFTLDLRTSQQKILLHSTDWVNHLLFSPTDPHILMYCHEGPWQKVDRIWTIHTDGTQNTLVHKRSMEMEIAGHEFWSIDGRSIWYDLQIPKGEDFWLAGYNLDTRARTWYHLARNEWSIHFNVTHDGTLFCGDGGDPGQVAHAPDGEWIYLFRPSMIKSTGITGPELAKPGVLHAEKLVNMSKHNYKLEPNVRFTPDAKWVIFRSNMFGPTYTFAAEVAKSGSSN